MAIDTVATMDMAAAATAGFLQYEEPDIISIVVLISFFFLLSAVGWAFNRAISASLIGQILLGVLYGAPVGNILTVEWQETFLALGYVGLVLIIFEGGLTIRLDLLKANFVLSLLAAAIGIITPIAFSYLLLYLGLRYQALETFIVGAALSTTSIGTTFVVISSSAKIDLTHTKVGTVLVSAALFDDVVGLIMVSVITNLGAVGGDTSVDIGWIIGRPIVASVAIGAVSPLLARYAAGPLYRRWIERRIAWLGHKAAVLIMMLVLMAHLVICGYAGASLLFGAFLAGTFLSALPSSPVGLDAHYAQQDRNESKIPDFHNTYEKYVTGAQASVLEPLFFASIGFAIPFKKLWTGTVIWRGLVFSLLMAAGKVSLVIFFQHPKPWTTIDMTYQAVVGLSVPLWDAMSQRTTSEDNSSSNRQLKAESWAPATLLGMAMVARGEIGLLIIQLGLNETSFLSEEAFLVAVWAIVVNTIIGPASVGLLLRRLDETIADDPHWGMQAMAPGKRSPSDVGSTPALPAQVSATEPSR